METAVDEKKEVPEEHVRQGELLEIDATRDITVQEHQLGFWAAVKQYPSATFWAIFFCIAVITAGYDGQIIFSFYALPAFQNRYGRLTKTGYEIPAPWQTGLGMGNPIGQVVGALASGYFMEKFGRRLTLAVCCVWSIAFVFVQFFATSLGMLCAGEILGGLAYGFYVVIAPTYASEICPLALRGFLTAFINLAFVIGQFIAQGVAAGVESRSDSWAYKAPFVRRFSYLLSLSPSFSLISTGNSMAVARNHPLRPPFRTREPLLAHPPKSQGGRSQGPRQALVVQEPA